MEQDLLSIDEWFLYHDIIHVYWSSLFTSNIRKYFKIDCPDQCDQCIKNNLKERFVLASGQYMKIHVHCLHSAAYTAFIDIVMSIL